MTERGGSQVGGKNEVKEEGEPSEVPGTACLILGRKNKYIKENQREEVLGWEARWI